MQQQQPRRHGVPVAESETLLMVKVMMSDSLLHLSYADNGKGNWMIFILYREYSSGSHDPIPSASGHVGRVSRWQRRWA